MMRDNMDELKGKNSAEAAPDGRMQDTSGAGEGEQLSLNDDRRVKVLSPGAMVAQRFFRNRIAVAGVIILIAMFLFAFVGGALSPYGEDEIFYRYDMIRKEYVAASENTSYRYLKADDEYGALLQAQTILAITGNKESFDYNGVTYTVVKEGEAFYSIYNGAKLIGAAYLDVISAEDSSATFTFDFQYHALLAYAQGGGDFTADGAAYHVDADGAITQGGDGVAVISRYVVQSKTSGLIISNEFKEALIEALGRKETEFTFTDAEGLTAEYTLEYDAATQIWSVKQETSTRVYDTYSSPSKAHWLGTDKNGMDMLTRLMYGGRVSLVIGFIVVIIETVLGVILGGISGYFGGWVDNLIMRIVDIFYCIPSTPLIIILGAAMDAMRVDPQIRMLYLMLVLGFLGWPSIARMVRGQILSLREQEFMTATEACGISVSRRIFRHLIPNVIPQLIVIATMSIGSTILTESTLSFLGLGVKFPFASWGNIINDVSNSFVLTSYWFIWIPAGFCILLTVLAFNFVGDGLRDAFDPKMKR